MTTIVAYDLIGSMGRPEFFAKIVVRLVRDCTNNGGDVRPLKGTGTFYFVDSGKPVPVDPDKCFPVTGLRAFFMEKNGPSVKKT